MTGLAEAADAAGEVPAAAYPAMLAILMASVNVRPDRPAHPRLTVLGPIEGRLIDAGEQQQARDYAAWVIAAAGGYAIKVVNPGGVELWKRGARERTDLETPIGSSRVTPRPLA